MIEEILTIGSLYLKSRERVDNNKGISKILQFILVPKH
jgi:hypothetical protein